MKKIIVISAIAVIFIIGIFLMSHVFRKPAVDSGKIRIVTTLFPLYDFTRNVGQEKAEVVLLLPPGIEAHAFEPKPADIIKIHESNLFIYTGKFMEPWAEKILNGLSEKQITIVDASAGIPLMQSADDHQHEQSHSPAGADPHIWLDFDNAKMMVANISKAMAEKDPANAEFYVKNAGQYIEKLTKLDSSFAATLAQCQSREIVYGGHYAFGYLAKRFGLKHTAAQGLSPDSEPTAKVLVELIEEIKRNNIKYIFYEEISSPRIAEMLSKETGARLLLLNGTHNLSKYDFENNATYISLMERNLENLATGLQKKN